MMISVADGSSCGTSL